MLPRLEAERALEQANLNLVTEGQQVEDSDRAMFFSNLQQKINRQAPGENLDDYISEGGIVIYEDAEGNPVDA